VHPVSETTVRQGSGGRGDTLLSGGRGDTPLIVCRSTACGIKGSLCETTLSQPDVFTEEIVDST
jgi:hypothetical protein